VIDAHAQEFVANNELLLPTVKAFAGALARHTLLEMLDIFSLFLLGERSVALSGISPVERLQPAVPLLRQTRPNPSGIIA